MTEPESKKTRYNYQQGNKWKYKRHVLENGLKGFLCTTNFSEKNSVREAYNILNQYADELYLNPTSDDQEKSETNQSELDDVSDELSAEISSLKTEQSDSNLKYLRFQATETGAKNCVFIKTTLDDPVQLATHIANDILTTKQQKTKDLLRLIPIEVVCKATVASVSENIGPLLSRHFNDKESKTFGIIFTRRMNNQVDKAGLIDKVASMVVDINAENKVNLNKPDITILLEIIKAWCLVSIVPEYNRLKKYNLLELSIDKSVQVEKNNSGVESNDN